MAADKDWVSPVYREFRDILGEFRYLLHLLNQNLPE